MGNLEEHYFIKRLESGACTKVMLMSHNAYWYQLKKYESRYSNYDISVFGSGMAYARLREHDIPSDCDFIILDGSEYYSEEEYIEAKKLAIKMSEDNNKRVTLAYVYIIPPHERKDSKVSSELITFSVNNGNINESVTPLTDYDLLTLVDIAEEMRSELDSQIILDKK